MQVSNEVLGQDFKFLDYYSTTNNKKPQKLRSEELLNMNIQDVVNTCVVSYFVESKEELLRSFPKDFMQ